MNEEDIADGWQLDILTGVTTADMAEFVSSLPNTQPYRIVVSAGIHNVRYKVKNYALNTVSLSEALQNRHGHVAGIRTHKNLKPSEQTQIEETGHLLKQHILKYLGPLFCLHPGQKLDGTNRNRDLTKKLNITLAHDTGSLLP